MFQDIKKLILIGFAQKIPSKSALHFAYFAYIIGDFSPFFSNLLPSKRVKKERILKIPTMSAISFPASYASDFSVERYSAAVVYFGRFVQSVKQMQLFHSISTILGDVYALLMKDWSGRYWDAEAQDFHQDFLLRMEKASTKQETAPAESQQLSKQEEKGRHKSDLTPMPRPVSV